MSRRIRYMLWRGAATALFACTGAAADPQPLVISLPQWVVRAQQRLGLDPSQQWDLRVLVDGNAERLREMRERHAGRDTTDARRSQLEEMAALQLSFRSELRGILTPEQLSEWDELIEELLGQVHLRHAPRMADSH